MHKCLKGAAQLVLDLNLHLGHNDVSIRMYFSLKKNKKHLLMFNGPWCLFSLVCKRQGKSTQKTKLQSSSSALNLCCMPLKSEFSTFCSLLPMFIYTVIQRFTESTTADLKSCYIPPERLKLMDLSRISSLLIDGSCSLFTNQLLWYIILCIM